MMEYKGYLGVARVDSEAGVIRGRVVNTRDVITFQGQTVVEARQAFQESVDDYLAFCAERGEEPEKPFSGKFLIRTPPNVHRALAARAAAQGVSLNALVNKTLARAAGKSPSSKGTVTSKGQRKAKRRASLDRKPRSATKRAR